MKNLKTKLDTLRQSDGFTIIEVMIVLAIAGVIMLIVLLTVPALQRNSRNTQRRSDAGHVASLINEYSANNGGAAPGGLTAKAAPTAGYVDMTKETLAIMAKPTAATDITMADATTTYTAPTPALDALFPYKGATCANNVVTGGASARSIVIVYYVEPGTIAQCVQV
jgi:prepilin-type N-terminal cleavage/methylation domain-containing protein